MDLYSKKLPQYIRPLFSVRKVREKKKHFSLTWKPVSQLPSNDSRALLSQLNRYLSSLRMSQTPCHYAHEFLEQFLLFLLLHIVLLMLWRHNQPTCTFINNLIWFICRYLLCWTYVLKVFHFHGQISAQRDEKKRDIITTLYRMN